MERWQLATLANGIVAVAYASISLHILRGVQRTGSWRTNPLAVATGLIFATCAAGHLGHLAHLVDPATRAFSVVIYDRHLVVIDAVTATIAIRYWLLRGRFPALVRGAAVFEDLAERRGQALDIHDRVVQELATAKLAIELGETDRGLRALERGLESSRRIVTALVGDDIASSARMDPGGLRRGTTP
jgi:signal transduction histidine kinase